MASRNYTGQYATYDAEFLCRKVVHQLLLIGKSVSRIRSLFFTPSYLDKTKMIFLEKIKKICRGVKYGSGRY